MNNVGSAKEQFDSEADALKQIIYEFIDSGHILMAAQVFEQYSLLNPTDPDLDEIRNVLYPQGNETVKQEIPDEYKILNDIETIFILSGIITKRTGYIDSVLRKIRLFEENWNYSPILLTCIHNIDHRKALTWLRTAFGGQIALSADTRVLNVYEYFQNSYADGLENKAVYRDNDKDEPSSRSKKYYTGYMGSLRTECFFDENGNTAKELIYDDWGYLNCVYEYSKVSMDIYDAMYFTTDGRLCIKAAYRYDTYDKIPKMKIELYDDDGNVAAQCNSNAELAAICLDEIASEQKFNMLVVEDGLMSKAATDFVKGKKRAAACEVIHSIFLNDANDKKSGPQQYYEHLCNNFNKFDAVITLTDAARLDFEEIHKISPDTKPSMFVIPHMYPFDVDRIDFEQRDKRKAVIVARLDTNKQIGSAVEIFLRVVEQLPDATLEIYGRGPREDDIRAQIKNLGLEKNVFLMGFTDEPLAVFNKGVLSMMTSAAEGFGLTIMESICNGCPAFSFDIKYGPSDIISEGKTGFLIPNYDGTMYAEKIVEYLKDENMQQVMSENCYNAAGKFGKDKFLENWYNMTDFVYRSKT